MAGAAFTRVAKPMFQIDSAIERDSNLWRSACDPNTPGAAIQIAPTMNKEWQTVAPTARTATWIVLFAMARARTCLPRAMTNEAVASPNAASVAATRVRRPRPQPSQVGMTGTNMRGPDCSRTFDEACLVVDGGHKPRDVRA